VRGNLSLGGCGRIWRGLNKLTELKRSTSCLTARRPGGGNIKRRLTHEPFRRLKSRRALTKALRCTEPPKTPLSNAQSGKTTLSGTCQSFKGNACFHKTRKMHQRVQRVGRPNKRLGGQEGTGGKKRGKRHPLTLRPNCNFKIDRRSRASQKSGEHILGEGDHPESSRNGLMAQIRMDGSRETGLKKMTSDRLPRRLQRGGTAEKKKRWAA